MVYDIFTFNNELDVLELRLNILNNYVDYFVIVEATETFSGIEKPLYYSLNKSRYSKFNDKIIHYVVNDKPNSIDDITNDDFIYSPIALDNHHSSFKYGFKEFYQKECIRKAILHLSDNDICFISDVDEIWNPNVLSNIAGDNIYRLMQNYSYINYLNLRNQDKFYDFTGTIATKYINIKNNCLGKLRSMYIMKTKYVYIDNGGWHFNAIGGIDKKINDWKHEIYTINYMNEKTRSTFISNIELPEYIKNNIDKYKHLML